MTDFNVSLGKGKDVQKLSSEDLKGGVRKDDIKDTQMQSIFSMLDKNNNGILENEEITKINNAVVQYANEDGDASNLSKKEAKHLISSLGLKGINVDDLFKFLGSIKLAASNIVSQTVDSDGSEAINVEYKADQEGNRVTKQYNPTTGVFIGSYTVDKNNNEFWQDASGKILSGKLANGTTYECKYNEQGKLEYIEFSRKDGSKYYWSADNKSYAQKTANGNLKVSPKQGETFDDTMKRLGITDPADQELFKKSNPKAFKRGYFLLTEPGNAYGDVYIPKAIADKLDINNVLVD